MKTTSPTEQTVRTIRAMRRQEELGYSVSDYLSSLPKATPALDTPVDASCRFAMAKWCNDIAVHCKYEKETVAIAMNCLDRFMSTPSGKEILLDRNQYQLAAMTALYSSVKIHEQEAMDPNLVSSLSAGVHSPKAVEAMEFKMLTAIKWRMNPPTAISFVRLMVDLFPHSFFPSCEKETIMDVAKIQIDLILNKYSFCTIQESAVALACMMNAIESVTDDGIFCANFASVVGKIISIDDAVLQELRFAIYELMNGSHSNENAQITICKRRKLRSSCAKDAATRDNSFQSSPRSVAVPQR
mmetsp:Transcript_12867/g.30083  ORF Transcript_12867/g.30083 Transcript_12867/m.30083 type:complete len:299 (-) Transcript_12867:226-1122(-)